MDELADTITADVAIVGAGIAGAGLAADLAGDFEVVLIEQESRPGYHSTGRSAAIFIQNYGNAGYPCADPRELAVVFAAGCGAVSDAVGCRSAGCSTSPARKASPSTRRCMAEGEDLRELSAR